MKVTRWLQSVLKFLYGHKQIFIKDLRPYSSKLGQRWDRGMTEGEDYITNARQGAG